MQAIILAGGFGTRLRSVIGDVPKPMAPIHGKPFLAYLLNYLISQGITDIVLSVHYLREQIEAFFLNQYKGIRIRYAIEEQPLGTGGAIKIALQIMDSSRPVFVINGDTFLKLNYQQMYAEYAADTQITMSLRQIPDCSRYGTVCVEDGRVIAFKETGEDSPGLINAGVYLLKTHIFKNYSLPAAFSFEKDFLFPNIQNLKSQAFIVNDYFIDIGIPADYERAKVDFM